MIRISIITVCRNDLTGLVSTFESIRAQDHNYFEWWVIDGNSTDGTVEWLRKNHRLKGGWISESDNGIYDAMNKGMGVAAGDYLLFLNSGDTFAGTDVVSRLVREIEQEKVQPDFVYSDSLDVEEQGTSYYRKAKPLSHIKIGMITRHQAMLYRRELVAHERYPSRFTLSGDYAFTASVLMMPGIRVLQIGFPICRFSLGGAHDTLRLKALREDFKIRNTILKLNYLTCMILFGVHLLHHYVRMLAPGLNKKLIYKS